MFDSRIVQEAQSDLFLHPESAVLVQSSTDLLEPKLGRRDTSRPSAQVLHRTGYHVHLNKGEEGG